MVSLCMAGSTAGPSTPDAQAAPERNSPDRDKPNIIVIISDEQNASMLGCMGDKIVETPNIDALASGGILLDGHYCASPISGPSRQSITTGKYVSRHNVWGNTGGCPDDSPSLPRIMTAAGYDAVLAGGMKYGGMHYGFSKYDPQRGGLYTPKPRKKSPESMIPKERTRLEAGVFTDNGDAIGAEFSPIGATDMSGFVDVERRENALEFLRSRKEDDKPFFMILGYIAPH